MSTNLSSSDKLVLLQYAIIKFDSEKTLADKLNGILSVKDIQRGIDTLIATQRVRRIGPDVIQNNVSHTDLPELPEYLEAIVDKI